MRLLWHPHREVILIPEKNKSFLIQKWNLYFCHLPKAGQEERGEQQPFYNVQITHARAFILWFAFYRLGLDKEKQGSQVRKLVYAT